MSAAATCATLGHEDRRADRRAIWPGMTPVREWTPYCEECVGLLRRDPDTRFDPPWRAEVVSIDRARGAR